MTAELDGGTAPAGYELLEEIGHGGTGVVYRARDVALDRDVAVKVLATRYAPTSTTARRFLAEARVTGQLQHPGIPAVHQVGTLKPANVMVGAFAEVQVMDWGLAKVLASGGCQPPESPPSEPLATQIRTDRESGSETQAGSMLGTPAFMPPEQAIGAVDQIDPRSDVFGLGAILCSILTGTAPYVGADAEATRQMAARAKLEGAFARLDGCGAEPELVALAKRCLAVDREDRPADAGAVARTVAELRAAAEQRARQAEWEQATAAARVVEQRRRRRILLIAGAGLVGVLLLGIVGTTLGKRRADLARHEAEAERDMAAQARDRTREVLDEMTSEATGDALTTQKALSAEQKQFLTKVLSYYRELAGEQGDDEQARKRTAAAAFRLGRIEDRLGRKAEGVAAVQQARDGYAALAADFPSVPGYRSDLAKSHNSLGRLLHVLGQRSAAEIEYRAAVVLDQKLAADFPSVPGYRIDLGGRYCNFGILLCDGGKPAESLAWYARAIATLAPLVEQEPRLATARLFLRNAHYGRAGAYGRLGRHAEALADWDLVLALSPPTQQARVHAERASSRLQAGQVAAAVAEVAELTKRSGWTAGQWYDFACVYALASGKDVKKREEYAARAVALLRQAIATGYKDAAHVAKDTDLESLRPRPDFQKLLADLRAQAPTTPPPPKPAKKQ